MMATEPQSTAPETEPETPARPRLTRREFLRAMGTFAAGAALAACTPGMPVPKARTGEKAQLVYQDWRTDWFPEMSMRMLEDFHAANPNIRVFYTPDPDNLEEKMLLDMGAGTAPDVLAGCCDFFPVWGQKDYLLDLQPYIDADVDPGVIAEWDRAQYAALLLPNGKRFGLPKYHGALALYYNKDLFDEYKVDYPTADWNIDDYLDAMRKLTKDRDGDGQTDLWGSMVDIAWERLQMHVNGWGGHFVDPADPTHSLMGEPPALKAMEWIRQRMWDDQVMATFPNVENQETRTAFSSGKLAMVEDGSWALKDILTASNFRVGVARFPKGPERRVTLATPDAFGIYAGTHYPEAAWELMKFLISKDYGLAMARANFLQPARSSLVDQWVEIIRAELKEKANEVDIGVFADGHINGYSVVTEIFPNMAAASELARSAWEKIYTLGQQPTVSLIEVSRQIQALQKPTGG